jgi:hypothetical protein
MRFKRDLLPIVVAEAVPPLFGGLVRHAWQVPPPKVTEAAQWEMRYHEGQPLFVVQFQHRPMLRIANLSSDGIWVPVKGAQT